MTSGIVFPPINSVPQDSHRPFWSVMIPTYNGTKYLEQTLKSVLVQDPRLDEMQIEVVDDCSTKDDPEELVKDIGQGRVSFFRNPENVGLVHNWNACIGSKPNPLDYFSEFALFALMSREDPYPLVCLEAASLAKPIICFDQAGGEPEFVEDDCGFVVPYLNLDAMADKILLLIKSPDLRDKMGIQAKQKVVSRHHISVAAPQIIEIIRHIQERESIYSKDWDLY